MKKILSLILAMAMLLSMGTAVFADNTNEKIPGSYDADWNLLKDWATLEEEGLVTYKDIVTVDGDVVYSNVLSDVDDSIEYIVIDGNCTDTLYGAFENNKNIKEVIINDGIETIEINTFKFAENLVRVDVPDSVTKIGVSAFLGTAITEVTVRNDVEYLKRANGSAQQYGACHNIKTVIIEEGVTEIPERMFNECYALETVVIPASVKSIGIKAFYDCVNLKQVIILSDNFEVAENAFDVNNIRTEYGDVATAIHTVNEAMADAVRATVSGTGASNSTVDYGVAVVDGIAYATFEEALSALGGNYYNNIDGKWGTIELLSNVETASGNWDVRYNGGTFAQPVVFNGNGFTVKFTAKIADGYNNTCAFRVLADSTFKNLTIDMSEATSNWGKHMRAISSYNCAVNVENCKFIGNPAYTSSRAIIAGENNEGVTDISNGVVTIKKSEFIDWYKGLTHNENGGDIKLMSVTDSTFENANVYLGAYEKIEFNSNKMENSWVSISAATDKADNLDITALNNELEDNTDTAENKIIAGATINAQAGFKLAVAQIGNEKYTSLKAALAAIGESEGDFTITLLTNVEESVTVTQYKNQKITITGDETNKPVIKGQITINARSNAVEGEALTIKNIVFDNAGATNASIFVPKANAQRYAMNVTVDNCEFIGAGENVKAAIQSETGGDKNWLVTNCTANGIHSLLQMKNVAGLTVDNCTVENCSNGINLNNSTGVEIKNSNIAVEGYGIRMGENGNQNAKITLKLDNNTITSTEGALVVRNGAENADIAITSGTYESTGSSAIVFGEEGKKPFRGATYEYEGTSYEMTLAISGGVYSSNNIDVNEPATNVPSEYGLGAFLAEDTTLTKTADGYKAISGEEAKKEAATVYMQFREVEAEEGEKKYEIVIVGKDEATINRLTAADLAFVFDPHPIKNVKMAYKVKAADGITLTKEAENRYMFNFDGISGADSGNKNEVVLGTITVDGYGTFTLKVDDTVSTNEVHATTLEDNLVDTFKVGGDLNKGEGVLVINTQMDADGTPDSADGLLGKVEGTENAAPQRELTINVKFPNTVYDQAAAYMDMTVTISGGDLESAIVKNLGKATGEAISYVIEENLTKDFTYNVTIEGAGYRTYDCAVKMTGDKTLTFWNNVRTGEMEVEEGNTTTKTAVTFLAGDIVKDNNINIYDLSAVVSYFATNAPSLADKWDYAKYDLNRDGKIDSKDVAYILVSWGK